MKKIIVMFIVLCTLISGIGVLSACSGSQKNSEKIKIVTTVFSEYDWTMNVLGDQIDNAEVALLLDSGADLHSYQPTVADIAKIATCDLFIYVGGESDEWVDDALKNATNPNMIVINLLETLGDKAKEEEIVEGMEGEEHDHDEGEEHDDEEEETEYDEHVWLSLKNAVIFVNEIASALGKIDKDNASAYESNAKDYSGKLSALDNQYEQAVAAATTKTLLFGDRFPFRYLVDDYEISYYAAFVGCSAETEASFETIVFLAGKVDELGLTAILKIESSDGSIAQTIKENTTAKNQKILTMDSLQSATKKEYAAGRTYLKVMQDNLAVLTEALG
ncbi:MAG: zinc ABC transporter substrate-binding protein [Clostridia bacterium]|nr:zinc ABC transporter substrate-binding protein [Clostridia bacterium]